MASPTLPYRSLRLTNIPQSFDISDVQKLFSAADQNAVLYVSLAPSILRRFTSTQSATITFKNDSAALQTALSTGYLELSMTSSQAGGRIGVDDTFHGLTPLNDTLVGDRTVDIVAVTGLAGRAFGSWQCSEGSMWLRDFLPIDVPDSRVYIFGYSSEVFGSNSEAGLLDHTSYFVRHLESARERSKRRPLILIGHSLGCLIIKQAIVTWANTESTNELYNSLYSTVLFGAPHKGIYTTALEELTAGLPTERLIQDLRSDSTVLRLLNESFPYASRGIKIISCYECRRTPTTILLPNGRVGRNGPEKMAVERNSSCLYTENEERIPINENHSMIAKLSSSPGSVYHIIQRRLREQVMEAPAVVRERFKRFELTERGQLDILAGDKTEPLDRVIYSKLREPDRHFLGRHLILEQVHDRFQGRNVRPDVVVLHGIGGAGKSQLTLKYIELHKQDYTAIVLVNVTTELKAEQDFREVAATIKGKEQDDAHHNDILFVVSWLSRKRTRWLLVLDNADDPTMFDTISEQYIPTEGNGNILITSRHKDYCELGYDLEVPMLSDEEAIRMLLDITGRGGFQAEKEAGKIAHVLGNLPLALAHAGAYIKKIKIPLDRYLLLYNERQKELLEYTGRLWTYHRSAATTWNISFQQVESISPAAANLLLLYGFLDQNISQDLFALAFTDYTGSEDTGEHSLPPWLLSVATTNGKWDEVRFNHTTALLCDFSLVDKSVDLGLPPSCIIHPVVQEWGKFHLRPERQEEFARLAIRFIHRCSSALHENLTPYDTSAYIVQRPLLLHVEACYQNSKRYISGETSLGAPDSAAAALRFGRLYWYEGKWEVAEELHRSAMANYEKDNPHYLDATLNLAATLRKRGKYAEACSLQEDARSQALNEEQDLFICNELTSTYRDQKRYDEAVSLQQNIVERRRRLSGDRSPTCLEAMASLAVIYYELGWLDDAVVLEQMILAQRRSLLGEDHLDTITTKANLAATFWKKGLYDEAESLELDVVERRRSILGENHWETIRAEGSLGATLRKQGRLLEAEVLIRKVLQQKREMLKADNPSTQRTLKQLCKVLQELNKHSEADSLTREWDQLPTLRENRSAKRKMTEMSA